MLKQINTDFFLDSVTHLYIFENYNFKKIFPHVQFSRTQFSRQFKWLLLQSLSCMYVGRLR